MRVCMAPQYHLWRYSFLPSSSTQNSQSQANIEALPKLYLGGQFYRTHNHSQQMPGSMQSFRSQGVKTPSRPRVSEKLHPTTPPAVQGLL